MTKLILSLIPLVLIALLVAIPVAQQAVKAIVMSSAANNWIDMTPHKPTAYDNMTAAEKQTVDDKLHQAYANLACLKNLKTKYVHAGDCGSPTIEQQLANARAATQAAQAQEKP